MLIIPVRQLPNDTTSVLVDGLVLKINCMWNSREEAWYVSLYDVGDNPIIVGQKIIQSQNITGRHGLVQFIDGDIYCFNLKTNQARPLFEDLGTELILAYVTKEETAEIISLYKDTVVYK